MLRFLRSKGIAALTASAANNLKVLRLVLGEDSPIQSPVDPTVICQKADKFTHYKFASLMHNACYHGNRISREFNSAFRMPASE